MYQNISEEILWGIDKEMTISGWIYSKLKFGNECISAKQRAGAQQFRCNYDMKNSKASCHINPFV